MTHTSVNYLIALRPASHADTNDIQQKKKNYKWRTGNEHAYGGKRSGVRCGRRRGDAVLSERPGESCGGGGGSEQGARSAAHHVSQ